MKNQDLKLKFIENGRLSDNQMNKINGGWSCGVFVACPGHSGKSECAPYKDCAWFSKEDCTDYHWVAVPEGHEVV